MELGAFRLGSCRFNVVGCSRRRVAVAEFPAIEPEPRSSLGRWAGSKAHSALARWEPSTRVVTKSSQVRPDHHHRRCETRRSDESTYPPSPRGVQVGLDLLNENDEVPTASAH